ncbi:hypothetical protein BDZ88DRAFT_401996 [Geranomyces variabilis]|nr:hypothetical protein BDZ88DRAFT_401996 [Geranomyces variabilis]KAJ3142811.1 hypothetical protein HDU90_002682 [Geranomyces variabilis]
MPPPPSPAPSCTSEMSSSAPPLVARSASMSDVKASPYMLRRKTPLPPLRRLSVHDLQLSCSQQQQSLQSPQHPPKSQQQQQQPQPQQQQQQQQQASQPPQQHHHHHYHHYHHHPQCWKHSQHQCAPGGPGSPIPGAHMSPLVAHKGALRLAETMSPHHHHFPGIMSPTGTMSPIRAVASIPMSPLHCTPVQSGAPTPGNATPAPEPGTPAACSPRVSARCSGSAKDPGHRVPSAAAGPSAAAAADNNEVAAAAPSSAANARIHDSNRRRLVILRDIFMTSPAGHYEACQELKDWCNDRRAYASELASDLDLTLRAVAEMGVQPAYDPAIALDVFKVVSRHRGYMTDMAAENCLMYTQALLTAIRQREKHMQQQFMMQSPAIQSPLNTSFVFPPGVKEEPSTPLVSSAAASAATQWSGLSYLTPVPLETPAAATSASATAASEAEQRSAETFTTTNASTASSSASSAASYMAGVSSSSSSASSLSLAWSPFPSGSTSFRDAFSAAGTWDSSFMDFQSVTSAYPMTSSGSGLAGALSPTTPATATFDASAMDFESLVSGLPDGNMQLSGPASAAEPKDAMGFLNSMDSLDSMDHDWTSGVTS